MKDLCSCPIKKKGSRYLHKKRDLLGKGRLGGRLRYGYLSIMYTAENRLPMKLIEEILELVRTNYRRKRKRIKYEYKYYHDM